MRKMKCGEFDDFDPIGDPVRCITFDKAAQDKIPPDVRARMDADRIKAQAEQAKELRGDKE